MRKNTSAWIICVVVVASAWVPARAWADPREHERSEQPTGFIIAPVLGARATYVWSDDPVNVPVSPSQYQGYAAGAATTGSQFGIELGYGFDTDWRVLADFRVAYIEQENEHDAGLTLILVRRVAGNLAIRWGLGYRDYQTQASVNAETTSGPERTSEIDWPYSIHGNALTGQLGVEYQVNLSSWYAIAIALDGTVGFLPFEDQDGLRFDDALSAGIQLAVGGRLFL